MAFAILLLAFVALVSLGVTGLVVLDLAIETRVRPRKDGSSARPEQPGASVPAGDVGPCSAAA